MSIAPYIKEIGRGKRGAKDLSREQAADLMRRVLLGLTEPGVPDAASALEIGAFCAAMRIKGETPDELAGFLDALEPQLLRVPTGGAPTVVIPAYNGARKLPALVPLLALLLARKGIAVLVHGAVSEPRADARVSSAAVLAGLGVAPLPVGAALQAGQVGYVPTEQIAPALHALLLVRRTLGLRNSAHSVVKLINPTDARALVLTSYTHREYLTPMCATLQQVGTAALVLRGTEGEPVADARRTPRMDAVLDGSTFCIDEGDDTGLIRPDTLPADVGVDSVVAYTQAVLAGELPLPAPLARQIAHCQTLLGRLA